MRSPSLTRTQTRETLYSATSQMASLSSLQQRFLLALHPYVCACRTLSFSSPCLGKGDQRTKRGKIARGTFGMLLIPLISF